MAFLMPPLFYGSYAILKYQLSARLVPTVALSGLIVFGLFRLGMISSNREIRSLHQELFNKYRDEVTKPQYRGLKLYNARRIYQIDNREFTTSNFDDLKQLVMKQKK